MVLDVGAVMERPFEVLALALGLVAVKVVVLTLIVKVFGKSWRVALGLGLLLSQGGEFGFLLFAQAADALLIEPEAASLFSAVVTLSMVTTPFLMLFARNLEFSPAAEPADLDDPASAPRGSAIVVGYGRFGQIVSQMLHGVACSVTLIDKQPSQIELSSRFDTKVYFGDGLRVDLLRRAGAEEARLIIFCIDDSSVDAAALKPVVDAFPNAKVLMRVFDRRQLLAIDGAGVDGVIREVFESSVAMGLDCAPPSRCRRERDGRCRGDVAPPRRDAAAGADRRGRYFGGHGPPLQARWQARGRQRARDPAAQAARPAKAAREEK